MRASACLLASLLLLSGCGITRASLVPEDNKVIGEGVLAVWGDWIVDKGDKFDVHLHLQNCSKQSIIVFARDISGAKGDSPGKVGFPAFGIGERTIDLAPAQIKSVTLGCKHGAAKGDFKITVNRVFANPSDDRRTPGEVVATKVKWVLPESAAK